MPFNGSGTASPLNPPTFPAVSGQTIEAAKFNAVINDLYACLTQCIVKDGQTVVTGVLQWADKPANLEALGAVSLTATQAIDGVKTFSSPPKSAVAASNASELVRKGELDAAVVSLTLPAGVITPFAGSVAPSGWLKCEGQVVSRVTYAALFAAIGTTYGPGDGSTTFKLPDLRGEFIRGLDAGRGVDAGRAFGSAQGDAIRNITGYFTGVDNMATSGAFTRGIDTPTDSSAPGGSVSPVVDFNASNVVPTAGENRPRNVALPYIIKT